MLCPGCRSPLRPAARDLAGHAHWRCPACEGTWCTIDEAIAGGLVSADAPRTLDGGTGLMACPGGDGATLRPLPAPKPVAVRPLGCPRCRHVFVPAATRAALRGAATPAPRSAARRERLHAVVDFENHPLVHAIAVPLAVAATLLVMASPWGEFFRALSISMPVHEIGHALAALLAGVWAIPLPFFTFILGGHAWSAVLAVGAAIGWLLRDAVRRRLPARFALGLLLLLPWVVHGLAGNDAGRDQWIVFMGIGGEFVLGALLVLAFFHRLHDAPSWDLVRFACLALGTAVLVPAVVAWDQIAAGSRPLPTGSFLRGGDDPGGDIDRLLAAGWSREALVDAYVSLGRACLFAVAVHWLWVARRGWRERASLGEAWRRLRARPRAVDPGASRPPPSAGP